MESILIKVARDFSPFPISRYAKKGKNSGEEMRIKYLTPALKRAIEEDKKLIVDLDGTAG